MADPETSEGVPGTLFDEEEVDTTAKYVHHDSWELFGDDLPKHVDTAPEVV